MKSSCAIILQSAITDGLTSMFTSSSFGLALESLSSRTSLTSLASRSMRSIFIERSFGFASKVSSGTVEKKSIVNPLLRYRRAI